MEQQPILTEANRADTRPTARTYRWMRYFFCEEVTPDHRSIVDLQRRATWIGLALILQTLNQIDQAIIAIDGNWHLPFLIVLRILLNSLLPILLTMGSFIAMWRAFRPVDLRAQAQYVRQHPAPWQRGVLVSMLLLAIAGSVIGTGITIMCFLPPWFANDGTALNTNAANLLLQGRNPYTDSSILDVARQFSIQPNWTTPLRKGQFADRLEYPTSVEFQSAFDTSLKSDDAPEFESKVSYPALSFLTLLPFVLFKNYNVLPLYLLSYLAIVLIAWKASQPALRPWIITLALANMPMWNATVGGNLDVFYSMLIILAWLYRGRTLYSSLFLALALASKQLAWFFIPFYFIMVWRNYSFKDACYRLTLAGGLGLAINLPFIFWNPNAWLEGILAPIADLMFPMGVGIINLSVTHLLPYFPDWVYKGLEGAAMLGSLCWYWRICRQRPEAAMLLAVFPLFFAWRSLPSYFCCTAYPLFILTVAKFKPGLRHASAPVASALRLPTQPRIRPQFLLSARTALDQQQ